MGNILSQMWGELTDSVPSNAVHVNEKPQGDSHYFWVGGLASIYLRGLGNFLGMEGGGGFFVPVSVDVCIPPFRHASCAL